MTNSNLAREAHLLQSELIRACPTVLMSRLSWDNLTRDQIEELHQLLRHQKAQNNRSKLWRI